MDDVLLRLSAARTLLADLRDTPALALVSTVQAKSLCASLVKTKLTAEEIGRVVSEAASVWSDHGDLMLVTTAAANAANEHSNKRARKAMQNYRSLASYFLEAEWQCLTSEAQTYVNKRATIIERALRLGCRSPDEPTLKWFGALALLCSSSFEAASLMPEHQRATLNSDFKKEFRRRARMMVLPDAKCSMEHLASLPDDSAQLKALHGELWNKAYGPHEQPAPCPISLSEVTLLDSGTKCRGAAGPSIGLAVSKPAAAGSMEQMANFMMQSMQAMQQQQKEFMMMAMGNNGAHKGFSMRDLQENGKRSALNIEYMMPPTVGGPAPSPLPGQGMSIAGGPAQSPLPLPIRDKERVAASGQTPSGVAILAAADPEKTDSATEKKEAGGVLSEGERFSCMCGAAHDFLFATARNFHCNGIKTG
jgi:hypothetical protein